tara:strand:- start:395 stop:646 length:252 start_codon:yes stop_codon:yes gene_type:complete
MSNKTVYKFIPSNFDFEKIKRKSPPQDKFVPGDDKVHIFLALIIEKYKYQEFIVVYKEKYLYTKLRRSATNINPIEYLVPESL